MLRRGQLRPEDFQHEASGAVRLTIPAKRSYIQALETEFATASTLIGSELPGSLNDHLWQQATGYYLACGGKGDFCAIRYR